MMKAPVHVRSFDMQPLLPSLQLAIEDPGANSSNCGEGYSCAYTNSISWASPTQPLPMELNPQVVFERLFGDAQALPPGRRGRTEVGALDHRGKGRGEAVGMDLGLARGEVVVRPVDQDEQQSRLHLGGDARAGVGRVDRRQQLLEQSVEGLDRLP